KQPIALLKVEAGGRLLRQDKADGIADFPHLKSSGSGLKFLPILAHGFAPLYKFITQIDILFNNCFTQDSARNQRARRAFPPSRPCASATRGGTARRSGSSARRGSRAGWSAGARRAAAPSRGNAWYGRHKAPARCC